MPWTRKQVRKLLSSGSPLKPSQKEKMKQELHSNPAMGHAKKGSQALKRKTDQRPAKGDSHAYVYGRKT